MPTLPERNPLTFFAVVIGDNAKPALEPFLYEIWQDDVIVAVVSGDDEKTVLNAVLAKADQYEADGPVDLYRVLRVKVIPDHGR